MLQLPGCDKFISPNGLNGVGVCGHLGSGKPLSGDETGGAIGMLIGLLTSIGTRTFPFDEHPARFGKSQ